MYHSDRGGQYASRALQDKLKAYGMICSMSRKGSRWGKTPTESWFNSFKDEWVHGSRFVTQADRKATCFECIKVFYAPNEAPLGGSNQPWVTSRRFNSWKIGSVSNNSKNW